ncbi:MAG: hypothetical protein EAZ53_03345 [Bacteroidetes bacterium]|nr:MAG: hypothetical protein EAZ53_03345 [Bacteroidota bacterium]
MFENINPMDKSTAIFEILIMLLVAAILGFILAWLLFRNKNAETSSVSDSNLEEIEKLKKKNNDLLLELGNVKRSNTDLSIKLDECNKRGQALKSAPVVTTSVAEKTVVASAPAPQKKSKPDDLKIVEGIGPKIEELLHKAGIITFADLSKADIVKLKEILVNAGSRFQMHDPSTWPKQSELARDGKFEELKKFQDELNAGRI